MSKQRTLDLFRRPEACKETSEDPQFWIEEVRLLKSLSPDPEEQIREPITFQKGLNVVWAPAPAMNQRKEINFAGHAAGKTTLCRLLRYLLGEQHIAAPGVKEAIEENFYNGWIVGKIHVASQPWIVARPLHHATRPRARCLKSDSFDELLGKPETFLTFDYFQKALAAAICAPLPVSLFGDGTTAITFAHVLQWLARDQDCHLTKLNFFRHPDSKSDSPNLSAESAYFLQRIILNLADGDLRKAITDCEKLEKEEKDLPADKEYQLRREKELNLYLESVTIKHPRSPLFTEIEIPIARKATDELEEQATKITRDAIKLAMESRTGIKTQLASLQEQVGAVKTNVSMAKAALREAQDTVDALEGKRFNLEVEKEKARKMPPSAYCRVPRQLAETCKLFCEWDVLTENEEQAETLIAKQKKDAARSAGQCQANLKKLEEEQKRIEKEIHSLNASTTKIDGKIETLEQKLKDQKLPYPSIRTKITELEEIIQKLARLAKRETVLKAEVDKAKALQEKLQLRHKKTEDLFVDEYAWTVAQIFGGEETETQCKFTREKITTKVSYHGKDLTSAAVTALETFCFDLAAMAFSCRGRGFHPRFLLHDSPREADMGEAPYGRLFDLIVQQSKDKPNFQHIVTTTSNPPDEYLKLPYLRLELDSSKPAGKLFGQDL
jgi:archaellum component FlaC